MSFNREKTYATTADEILLFRSLLIVSTNKIPMIGRERILILPIGYSQHLQAPVTSTTALVHCNLRMSETRPSESVTVSIQHSTISPLWIILIQTGPIMAVLSFQHRPWDTMVLPISIGAPKHRRTRRSTHLEIVVYGCGPLRIVAIKVQIRVWDSMNVLSHSAQWPTFAI